MMKKIVWLLVSCLMVATLVLASCAPKEEVVTPKEEVVKPKEEVVKPKEEVVKPKEEEVVVVAPAAEKPTYGGVFVSGWSASPTYFDSCIGGWQTIAPISLSNEDLMGMDYRLGPSGTGEVSYMYATFMPAHMMKGVLAESWEMPNSTTLVFKIRKGIRWHNKPPTNGRELTSDDVVFSLARYWDLKKCARAPQASWYGWDKYMESITAPDKYTVVVKSKPGMLGQVWEMVSDTSKIYPRDAVEYYGNMNDWKTNIGTGPFIITDYVKDSAWTMQRNPNYWDTDPDRPQNQLPYLDGVKGIIMPDISTQMSALRTDKIDYLRVNWEDALNFQKTKPELKSVRYLNSPPVLGARTDKPELPFYNKKVRDALSLAINRQEIIKTFYGGNAELFVWPGAPIPEFADTFTPLNEYPQSVQELYTYNPTKAKQLLAEAGYPNGFKTEIMVTSTQVDLASIVKAYWAEVGVELKLDVKESAVKSTSDYMKAHKEITMVGTAGYTPFALGEVRTGHVSNYAIVSDKKIDTAFDQMMSEIYFDYNKKLEILNSVKSYITEQNWFILLPASYSYTIWQPWVKNYGGEYWVGFLDWDFPRWLWIDQDLKEKMTGRR